MFKDITSVSLVKKFVKTGDVCVSYYSSSCLKSWPSKFLTCQILWQEDISSVYFKLARMLMSCLTFSCNICGNKLRLSQLCWFKTIFSITRRSGSDFYQSVNDFTDMTLVSEDTRQRLYWCDVGCICPVVINKQARKSSKDTQIARYARFEKVWAG